MLTDKPLGFTLIELLIALTIVGVLTTIALPSYQSYTRRAHYSEVVQATAPYKLGVEECYQLMDTLTECTAGHNGVPTAITSGHGAGLVNSIAVKINGKITVTPNAKYGIKTIDTYELTPTITNERLTWNTSGGGVAAGYAN